MIGWPPPPSMKKTTARAPSKTDSSLGQPPVHKHRLDPRHFAQALRQELAAGVEFVIARAVAGPARDQHDLGRVGGTSGFVCKPSSDNGGSGQSEQFPHEKAPCGRLEEEFRGGSGGVFIRPP